MQGDPGGLVTVAVALGIELRGECELSGCAEFAEPLHRQLSHGYEVCSVLEIPVGVDRWREDHRTARKRADRAERRGYVAGDLEREKWENDIWRINTSTPERQGRPMANGYTKPVTFSPLTNYPCRQHAIRTSGVWTGSGHLVGYLTMYRCGDLALVSQILGHATFLADEIMFLLFQHALGRETHTPGVVVYNRHDSGTDGLRWFKERLGFEAVPVEWLP